ncbi:MAG: MBL fold metallo-hydrolase, partial [Casimicrobiaceae bacterium]
MAAIIPIPAFADNYIWLIREGSSAAVVDPGHAAPVIAYLDAHALALTAIVTTHHHADHVGGNRELLARWSCPVLGPAHETIPGRTLALGEGDRVDVPGLPVTFDVLDIPGHTAGHVAYV